MSVTLVCGTIPATMLLILALVFSLSGLWSAFGDPFYLAILETLFLLGWLSFATLGTIGLWRVSMQDQFVSRTNFYFLAAGLLAIWPSFLSVVIPIAVSAWHPEPGQLLLTLGPVVTAFAYLVAMVILRARDTANSRTNAS